MSTSEYPDKVKKHRARVMVVGSSNTDMVVRTRRIPAPGETVLGGDFQMVSGGKGANQAVAAAQLGAEVMLVARVGTDIFGEQAIASIGAAGVSTQYILRDEAASSGVALIFVDEAGQNSIVVAPGANARLRPEDVEAARPAFVDADVVVLQLEVPLETVGYAISVARELGKQVILNPAPAADLPAGFLQGVTVITPNEVETAMLLGWPMDKPLDGQEAARALLDLGVSTAVVTLGPQGAAVATSGRMWRVEALPVQPVDTTAAGDCFTGALACALGEGREIGAAVAFANAAAALSVTRPGAQPSMPTRQEVLGIYNRIKADL